MVLNDYSKLFHFTVSDYYCKMHHNNMQSPKDKIQSDTSGMSTLQSDITCLFRDLRATSD